MTVNKRLLKQIEEALGQVDGYGSVELYIQKNIVTQITSRTIKKTNNPITELSQN